MTNQLSVCLHLYNKVAGINPEAWVQGGHNNWLRRVLLRMLEVLLSMLKIQMKRGNYLMAAKIPLEKLFYSRSGSNV